jgi:hypothetical protein
VREINKINERELELGVGTASWHDEYKGTFAPATRVSVSVEKSTIYQIRPTYSLEVLIMT